MSRAVVDRDMGMAGLLERIVDDLPVSVFVGIRGDGELIATDDGVIDNSDLVTIAAANEFGTATIPERSFLRSTVDENQGRYIRFMATAAGQVLDGVDPAMAYGRVGMVVVGDVQRKIRNRIPPPNAPSTISRKGSDVPLIDTGRLRQSIDYTIEGLTPKVRS